MIIIKKDNELADALRVREDKILVVEGLAEELHDKFNSDDPRIYGTLSGSIAIPNAMINLIFGSLSLYNSLLTILRDYDIEDNIEEGQMILFLKKELRKN